MSCKSRILRTALSQLIANLRYSRKGLGTQQQGKTNSTPEELASELKTFDMKVHRAQLQMVREWTTKLRNLGVPFFGTSSDLVIPFGKGEVTPGDGGRKLEKGMIHESDCKFCNCYSAVLWPELGSMVIRSWYGELRWLSRFSVRTTTQNPGILTRPMQGLDKLLLYWWYGRSYSKVDHMVKP